MIRRLSLICVLTVASIMLPAVPALGIPGTEGEQPAIAHGDPVVPPRRPAQSPRPYEAQPAFPAPAATGNPTLDLLVVYSANAAAAAGGDIELRQRIIDEVDETNSVFERSGITARMRLVGIESIVFPESGDSIIDLGRLQNKTDGYADDVHGLRDGYGADLVSLIVGDFGVAGRGYQLTDLDPYFEQYAFSVLHEKFFDVDWAMAHEIGHNLGAGHDVANGAGAFSDSHGYRRSGQFRTVMAYDCRFDGLQYCPVIPTFSNPEGSWLFLPTGDSTTNNARTINATAAFVSSFRATVVPEGDVPPTVDMGRVIYTTPGTDVVRVGIVFDPGSNAWTSTVDYGEGAGVEPGPKVTKGTVTVSHTYPSQGVFRLSVCVTDDSKATGCGSVLVVVSDSYETPGLIDPTTGQWHLIDTSGFVHSFYFGNPGDVPFMGDWNCDGIDTPGLYRQSDGFVYLRNLNNQGFANVEFFFGNPGDVPIPGDFNGDGCDSVSIYRPATGQFFIINALGTSGGGLGAADYSFYFGDPGDIPFVGDTDGDGLDEVGLYRVSSGFVYFRTTLSQGPADFDFFYGDPGDRLLAADWTGDGTDTVGLFRPSATAFYLNFANEAGIADDSFVFGGASNLPVAGVFGLG